jgi:hypothetical protein
MSITATAEVFGVLVIFLGGVALGILVIVSVAIKREDRKFSLTHDAPDAATRGARVLTGVGCRSIQLPDTWTKAQP